jgi:ABC-type polysaccharide/polyol phosphate transport system ATPase subunit
MRSSTRSSAFAEIERFLDTPVKRYSSGMYVRLAFAVAAHLQPEILIVDEVLAVAMPTSRRSASARCARCPKAKVAR